MLDLAKTSHRAMSHIPDERDWEHMDRKWLADVLYTVEKGKFETAIKNAVKARKERIEEKQHLNV
jgi:hypothetical protein